MSGTDQEQTGDVCAARFRRHGKVPAEPFKAWLTAAGALLEGGSPDYNLYQASDGWVAVVALEPRFDNRLCELFGVAAPSHERFAECFATETGAYCLQFAQDHDPSIAMVADPPLQIIKRIARSLSLFFSSTTRPNTGLTR